MIAPPQPLGLVDRQLGVSHGLVVLMGWLMMGPRSFFVPTYSVMRVRHFPASLCFIPGDSKLEAVM